MRYVGAFKLLRSWTGYCTHHGNTHTVEFEGWFQHENCGGGNTMSTRSVCWTCQHMNKTHNYKVLQCGKEGSIEGYQLVCKKTGSSVDAWSLGCGKNEKTLEEYALSCGKTEESIERYQRNCGRSDKDIER